MDCSLVRTLVQRYVSAARWGTWDREGTGPRDQTPLPPILLLRPARGPRGLGRPRDPGCLPGDERDSGRTCRVCSPGFPMDPELPQSAPAGAPTCSRSKAACLPGVPAVMELSWQRPSLGSTQGPGLGGVVGFGLLSLLHED